MDINTLTYEQLSELKTRIQERLDELDEDDFSDEVNESLEECGYYLCYGAYRDTGVDHGFLKFKLKLKIHSKDLQDHEDPKVAGFPDDNYDIFRYITIDNKYYNFPSDWEQEDKIEWEYGDWDSPATLIVNTWCSLWYKFISLPLDGRWFVFFEDDKEVLCYVKDDKIYNNQHQILMNVDKWDPKTFIICSNQGYPEDGVEFETIDGDGHRNIYKRDGQTIYKSYCYFCMLHEWDCQQWIFQLGHFVLIQK